MEGEFQDWELLQSSVNSPRSEDNSRNFGEIEDGAGGGMFRSDHFSLDNHSIMYPGSEDVSDHGSAHSDNPSWIDPGSETRYGTKHESEFWSDTSSDQSVDRKFGEFDVKNEVTILDIGNIDGGALEYAKRQGELRGDGEIQVQDKDLGKDFGGDRSDSMEFEVIKKESEIVLDGNMKKEGKLAVSGEMGGGDEPSEVVKAGEDNCGGRDGLAITSAVNSGGGGGKKGIVWWKVPFEILKYCMFKVSPVWSFSMAAAVMGFVILGRRLYKMKKSSRSLQSKVTVDDKKVSVLMSRVARLNEAFTVVRRVPIIRPSLPSPGLNQWHANVMSLR